MFAQGRLYLFENYVCFHSNVFGYVKVKVIPLADVTGVFRRKTALVVPNAVEVRERDARHTDAARVYSNSPENRSS